MQNNNNFNVALTVFPKNTSDQKPIYTFDLYETIVHLKQNYHNHYHILY